MARSQSNVPDGAAGDRARFLSKVQLTESGCWEFRGSPDNGYGRFWSAGRTLLAHRYAWELLVGPIPEDLQLDHLCRNRLCVSPAHLEPVTIRENVLRGVGVTAENAVKTHCTHGHEFTPENTQVRKNGSRACRTCAVERTRAWRAEKKVTL
jgi:hypothetical protein